MDERTDELGSGSEAKQRIAGAADEALQTAKEKAQSLGHAGKERAFDELEARKSGVAKELSRLGHALDSSAREVSREGDSFIASPLQQVAEFCEQASSSLSQKGPRQLFNDVENFGRKQPALFFGVAMAAGFLATRLLRSDPEGAGGGSRAQRDSSAGVASSTKRGH